MANLRHNGSVAPNILGKDPEIHLTIPSQGVTLLRPGVGEPVLEMENVGPEGRDSRRRQGRDRAELCALRQKYLSVITQMPEALHHASPLTLSRYIGMDRSHPVAKAAHSSHVWHLA